MISQEKFFTRYNLAKADFEKTGLLWQDLDAIYEDYLIYKRTLEDSAIFIFNSLMKGKNVHSVRYRIKDAEHLVEKIIRKKIDDADSDINLENYKDKVTDLIGLRALHLFKNDWDSIDAFIREQWELKEIPVANYRKGDSDEMIQAFKDKGCEPKEHRYGYRSVHYIIETQPAKQKHYAEIQVRTIFEEAWAEIDHRVRYPYDLENELFFQFLSILNRLAGGADEMGSFIQVLKTHLSNQQNKFRIELSQKDNVINSLQAKINMLNDTDQRKAMQEDLEKLRNKAVGEAVIPKNSSLLRAILDAQKANDMLKQFQETQKHIEYLKSITGK